MPVAPGVGQPLHQEHAHALGPPGAVGGLGEGLAPPVDREPPLPRELHERTRRRHHRHTTGQRQITLTVPQRLHRQMQRHQRRRTRRVHRHRRTLKPQRVRHPAGDHGGGVAGEQVAAYVVGDVAQPCAVLLVGAADEDTGATAPGRLRVDARVFEGLPRGLQQQPLLRVHGEGLARGDPEERGVEVARVVDEAALSGVTAVHARGVRVVERLGVPATVGGPLGDRVGAGGQQLPVVLGGPDATGEPAAHPDDRDRLIPAGLQLLEPPTGLGEVGGDPLEVVPELVFIRHWNLPHTLVAVRNGRTVGLLRHERSGAAEFPIDEVEDLVVRGGVELLGDGGLGIPLGLITQLGQHAAQSGLRESPCAVHWGKP